MNGVVAAMLGLGALAGLVALSRWSRKRRHGGSRTVDLRIIEGRIQRTLADGRSESVVLRDAVQVEVVRTPVATADGARSFALVASSLDHDEPVGCLVPLGVGWDEALLDALGRLEGFDLAAWSAARTRHAGREVVWRRRAGGAG